MADERENTPKPTEPVTSAPQEPDARPSARLGPRALFGRRIAQGLYFVAVAGIAIATTVQVCRQVFYPPPPLDALPFSTCRSGISALYQAIEEGRGAAERGDDGDEEAALLRYRGAVQPVWHHRDAVAAMCRGDEQGLVALDAIERLRYSEEHIVRHQAVELTALRRHVKELAGAAPLPGKAKEP